MAARRPFRGGALLLISSVLGFSFEQGCSRRPIHARTTRLALTVVSREVVSPSTVAAPSSQWELDFFSRPVQGADGKKLWELLVTDGTGSFRHVEAVPSNCVNSRELRTRVQRVIDASNVKPENIRFFRKQMKNMISIALGDLPEVRCVPSRATYQLSAWLEEREATVYPGMSGYRKPRPEAPGMKMPVRLPEQLRGEKYAFVTLPYAEFVEGTINEDNIGFGALCPLPAGGLPADALVHGLVIFSKRSAAISAWLTGIDLVFVKASLETREVLLEVGLDTQYLLARIKDPQQKLEAQLFEEGKETTNGLHFLSIQSGPEADAPDGFWLLKDFETVGRG